MIISLYYYSPFDRRNKCVSLDCDESIENVERLYDCIASKESIANNCFKIYLNGKRLKTTKHLNNESFISIDCGLVGGKGGFGSMLRAIGAQIEKTTNREACRDLSGRRLRDVNEEKRIKEWIAREAQRKEEMQRKRRERLEKLTREPKCEFKDDDYELNRSQMPDMIDDALRHGLKQSTSRQQTETTAKRKLEDSDSRPTIKKSKASLWLGVDSDDESGDDDQQLNKDEPQDERQDDNKDNNEHTKKTRRHMN